MPDRAGPQTKTGGNTPPETRPSIHPQIVSPPASRPRTLPRRCRRSRGSDRNSASAADRNRFSRNTVADAAPADAVRRIKGPSPPRPGRRRTTGKSGCVGQLRRAEEQQVALHITPPFRFAARSAARPLHPGRSPVEAWRARIAWSCSAQTCSPVTPCDSGNGGRAGLAVSLSCDARATCSAISRELNESV